MRHKTKAAFVPYISIFLLYVLLHSSATAQLAKESITIPGAGLSFKMPQGKVISETTKNGEKNLWTYKEKDFSIKVSSQVMKELTNAHINDEVVDIAFFEEINGNKTTPVGVPDAINKLFDYAQALDIKNKTESVGTVIGKKGNYLIEINIGLSESAGNAAGNIIRDFFGSFVKTASGAPGTETVASSSQPAGEHAPGHVKVKDVNVSFTFPEAKFELTEQPQGKSQLWTYHNNKRGYRLLVSAAKNVIHAPEDFKKYQEASKKAFEGSKISPTNNKQTAALASLMDEVESFFTIKNDYGVIFHVCRIDKHYVTVFSFEHLSNLNTDGRKDIDTFYASFKKE